MSRHHPYKQGRAAAGARKRRIVTTLLIGRTRPDLDDWSPSLDASAPHRGATAKVLRAREGVTDSQVGTTASDHKRDGITARFTAVHVSAVEAPAAARTLLAANGPRHLPPSPTSHAMTTHRRECAVECVLATVGGLRWPWLAPPLNPDRLPTTGSRPRRQVCPVTRPLVVYDAFMFVAPGVPREQPSGLLAPRLTPRLVPPPPPRG